MSGRRYSGRRYRRRRSPVPVILLLIVAAALVLGALAIFTDVFKKDRPADRADGPAVIQPDDTQKPDDAQQPSGGADGQDGQTGGDTQQPDNSGSQTGSKTLDTITTDATPYQSGGVYIVGDTGFEMYNYVDSLAKNYGEIVTSVAEQLSGVSTVYALAVPLSDTLFAFCRRILHGQSPFHADRGHFHHKLMDLGLNQKQAVAILYAISATLGLAAVVLTTKGTIRIALLILALLIGFVVCAFIRKSVHKHHIDVELQEAQAAADAQADAEAAEPEKDAASAETEQDSDTTAAEAPAQEVNDEQTH